MQSSKGLSKLRPISRNLFKHSNKVLTTQRPRTMALFPRYTTANTPYDGGLKSVFRLMDDIASSYDNASSTAIRAFSPKFDVIEERDCYKLHGELPGLDQKDVSIEFTDPHTLVIKGHTETRYEASEPEEQGGDNQKATEGTHKATVEDESAEKPKETAVVSSEQGKKDVAKSGRHHRTKYWVSERSVGEFHRSFTFPSPVDHDGVKATLKNGVLSITVPKLAATKGSRKINIQSEE